MSVKIGFSVDDTSVFSELLVPHSPDWFGRERVQYIRDDVDGTFLRVHYPAGSSSANSHRRYGSPLGGAQRYLRFAAGPCTEAFLSYRIRFDAFFDFGRGGKLPGLYGGRNVSGGKIPDGTNGASVRVLFRSGGTGETYVYMPSSERVGTVFGRGAWHWQRGRWHRLELRLRLNEPGAADGAVGIAVDGVQVLAVEHLVFRTVDTLKIEGVFFSTFFGGSDASWGPARDTYCDFADFRTTRSE